MSTRIVRTLDPHELQPPTEPIANFHWRHGPDYIGHNSRLYYSDGAWRENSSFGAMAEPSTDPVERCKMIAFFHKLKLKNELREFDAYKAMCTHPHATPSEDNLDHLKQLQAVVTDRRHKLAEVEAEIRSHQRAPEIKKWERYVEREHEALKKVQAELDDFVDSMPEGREADDDLEEIEILERQVQRAERKLQLACVNLHRSGGTVADEFQHYLNDYFQQVNTNDQRQRELWVEAKNLTV
ncbi:hypothetical protein [Roseimaritima ulvae]|uniref:Uncharacterized protein n=1 Tax=Roseimaritima ulvae TaxID=980254 RepID=A0A5B9QZH5_9BACT|nr:hypothetical protein [Roseimaritima ulvae]QEG39393.1 hypothetical protein UC8_13700 [Roseimaritima ulvae]